MRATGNLKHVQRLLGHEDIATTSRYAHVTNDDLLDAMNRASLSKIPTEIPTQDEVLSVKPLKD